MVGVQFFNEITWTWNSTRRRGPKPRGKNCWTLERTYKIFFKCQICRPNVSPLNYMIGFRKGYKLPKENRRYYLFHIHERNQRIACPALAWERKTTDPNSTPRPPTFPSISTSAMSKIAASFFLAVTHFAAIYDRFQGCLSFFFLPFNERFPSRYA